MKVKIIPIELNSNNKNLILKYIRDEFSFFTENENCKYFSSILINDINISFNEDGIACSIFGISVMEKWMNGRVSIPNYKLGSLIIDDINNEFIAGVSCRVNSSNKYWPVVFDKKNGWVEIKNNCKIFESVKIFDGVIIGVEEGEIIGLWLRPEIMT